MFRIEKGTLILEVSIININKADVKAVSYGDAQYHSSAESIANVERVLLNIELLKLKARPTEELLIKYFNNRGWMLVTGSRP